MSTEFTAPRTLHWLGDETGHLRMIDQTLLPGEFREIDCRSVADVWEAIRWLKIRGAPAIGVAAAYGLVLGGQTAISGSRDAFDRCVKESSKYLATSRPTAVNLFWALNRMERLLTRLPNDLSPRQTLSQLLREAILIETEDREMCAAIGRHGAELLQEGDTVLTHCNAGALATAGDGTALAVIFAAVAQGKRIQVIADETRPLLQGARLTAWELQSRGIPVTLICDSAAGWLMHEGRVQKVIVGADRIAANGDAANKIGTYTVACLASIHTIPFYVAAPSSTWDNSLACGTEIPIERRSAEEVTHLQGNRIAPSGVTADNPAFDVTPAERITAIITEHGIFQPGRGGRKG